MIRCLLLALLGLAASGCATRGALNIACPDFRSMVTELRIQGLRQDIHADAEWPQSPHRHDFTGTGTSPPPGLSEAVAQLVDESASKSLVGQRSDILLLSGGGQWGAFGVGFLRALARHRPEHLPQPGLITGVSTGALQTFFLALPDGDRFERLHAQYQPAREDEIVDRNAMELTPLYGSMAGLTPLRRRIERALCIEGNPAKGCPMIAALAAGQSPHALVGFVEASTGRFLVADIRHLARLSAGGRTEHFRLAQRCLTGAALASAAMPVFFQQVRIDGKAYYDGGVRHSVFEEEVAQEVRGAALRRIQSELEAASDEHARIQALEPSVSAVARRLDAVTPRLFVIRNGPTVLDNSEKPDRSAGPLANALRAEAIAVNELEVGSIAALRLYRPAGDLFFISADGFRREGGCVKTPPEAMFSPSFMECLALFGATRAARESPWRSLRPIGSFEGEVEPLLAALAN
jgi:hypothetical protein